MNKTALIADMGLSASRLWKHLVDTKGPIRKRLGMLDSADAGDGMIRGNVKAMLERGLGAPTDVAAIPGLLKKYMSGGYSESNKKYLLDKITSGVLGGAGIGMAGVGAAMGGNVLASSALGQGNVSSNRMSNAQIEAVREKTAGVLSEAAEKARILAIRSGVGRWQGAFPKGHNIGWREAADVLKARNVDFDDIAGGAASAGVVGGLVSTMPLLGIAAVQETWQKRKNLKALKATRDLASLNNKKLIKATAVGAAGAGLGVGVLAGGKRDKTAGVTKHVQDAMDKARELGLIGGTKGIADRASRHKGMLNAWANYKGVGAKDDTRKKLVAMISAGKSTGGKALQEGRLAGVLKSESGKAEAAGKALMEAKDSMSEGLGARAALGAGVGLGVVALRRLSKKRQAAKALLVANKKKKMVVGAVGAAGVAGLTGAALRGGNKEKTASTTGAIFDALPASVRESILELGVEGIGKMKSVAKGGLGLATGMVGYGTAKAGIPWMLKRLEAKKLLDTAKESNDLMRKGQAANQKAMRNIGIGAGVLGAGLGVNALVGSRRNKTASFVDMIVNDPREV